MWPTSAWVQRCRRSRGIWRPASPRCCRSSARSSSAGTSPLPPSQLTTAWCSERRLTVPESDPSLSEEEKLALVRDGYDQIAERYTKLASEVDDAHPRNDQVRRLLGRLSPRS